MLWYLFPHQKTNTIIVRVENAGKRPLEREELKTEEFWNKPTRLWHVAHKHSCRVIQNQTAKLISVQVPDEDSPMERVEHHQVQHTLATALSNQGQDSLKEEGHSNPSIEWHQEKMPSPMNMDSKDTEKASHHEEKLSTCKNKTKHSKKKQKEIRASTSHIHNTSNSCKWAPCHYFFSKVIFMRHYASSSDDEFSTQCAK